VGALRALEKTFLEPVLAQIARKYGSDSLADEVGQRLREKLLLPGKAGGAGISRYGGHGSLEGWLRVAATRVAIDIKRADRAEARRLEGDGWPGQDPDVELQYLRSRYGQEFDAALRAAFSALPQRDALVLRLHFMDRTSCAAIGSIYGTSARTVQRWIDRARKAILAQVRHVLVERLHLPEDEIKSLMLVLQSNINLTISRYLRHGDTRRTP
jgi:RNA polymerase sigma-70 factor (ECF subfamily)